jgi:hypothetical protein
MFLARRYQGSPSFMNNPKSLISVMKWSLPRPRAIRRSREGAFRLETHRQQETLPLKKEPLGNSSG